jgi:hypothetical protein
MLDSQEFQIMATRCKTVEFAFQTNPATLAAATPRSLATVTVYLPESSKTFRSVTLETGCTDDLTSASSAASYAMALQLDSEDPYTVTVTETIEDSGESSVYHASLDVTEYFALNWDGTSMTATAFVQVGTNSTNNHWAKLKITYEYDDTSTTHVKTIWYPIETTRTLLTTSYQTVGGANAIPAIKGGLLPEHNVTVRQVWVELLGNQGTANDTDFNLDVKLTTDATEQLTLYRVEAALATPGWLHAIWDITSSALTAAQPFEAKVTGVTNRVPHLCGWVGITYEFEPAGTNSVWNSLMLPAFSEDDQHGATTSARKTLHVKDFWIEEPATITTQASQVYGFYSDTRASTTISMWVGGQGPRTFTTTANGASMILSQRIDAGGASAPLGMTFNRGRNRVKVNDFSSNVDPGAYSAVNGFMIVNYVSGKAAAGVGTHNQTRHFALGWFEGDATHLEYGPDSANEPKTPTIPETNYFLNAVALQSAWIGKPDTFQALRIQAQWAGSEGPGGDGAGWANVYHGAIGSLDESWLRWTTADCTRLFRRWTGDADTGRMDVETARRWLFLNHGGVWVGSIGLLVTYHSITSNIRATVRGSAGDGSGLTVNISRNSTGEKLLTATTAAGGVYEATWYDDTEPLVADVYEDESHMGRSAAFYAGE